MNDTDIMPWGKFKGTEMQNVPAYYLIWLYDNHKATGDVKKYIEDNREVLDKEIDSE